MFYSIASSGKIQILWSTGKMNEIRTIHTMEYYSMTNNKSLII